MIKVEITKSDQGIQKMMVSGHALFEVSGQDIVCAGVSSIMVGLLNALDLKTEYHVEINDEANFMLIETQQVTKTGQLICEVGLVQLQTVAQQFPSYIKIREVKL